MGVGRDYEGFYCRFQVVQVHPRLGTVRRDHESNPPLSQAK